MTPTARSLVSPPLVYAHRGGAALRPENTLAAFDHGLGLGTDGLELDVHLSRDGVVVVHHDPTLDRTTNGHGRLVDHSAADLSRLDAGFHFRPRELAAEPNTIDDSSIAKSAGDPGSRIPGPSSDDERMAAFPFRGRDIGIPTLAAVLSRYPGIPVIIELKVDSEELARRTIDVVRKAGAAARVALGSFGARVLGAARAIAPEVATGAGREETRWALYKSWVGWPIRNPAYREFQVPERSGRTIVVSRRFVAQAHRAGVAVKVWTVDDEADIVRLLDWGVDGIISDRPDVAVRVVAARRR